MSRRVPAHLRTDYALPAAPPDHPEVIRMRDELILTGRSRIDCGPPPFTPIHIDALHAITRAAVAAAREVTGVDYVTQNCRFRYIEARPRGTA